ncbi:glycosyltransferase [Marvinbryantia sp.]|uniref:glycosyltransferase n=1 Tax=Marvinbryantia sp. TaxID=2496532 RepID=UPI00266F7261|nr:glycosyltransferase [uncultured Marvinbryantia sp.]
MLHSIIIPCYNSDRTIRKVVETTMEEMERLGRNEYEFVLVDDYSPNNPKTINELRALAEEYDCVRVVELAFNSGQHNAVMAGLNYAEGDILIAMDDDGQTHPSQIKYLFAEFDKGYDIVYGYYEQKKQSPFRNFGSYVNYMTVRWLIGKPKGMKTSSYWVIRRFVRDSVIRYESPFTHLQGLFLRTTKNISSVPIQHFKREIGQSNYTLKKLLQLWSNIMGFSVVPLRVATRLGCLFSILGLVGVIAVFINKAIHPAVPIGWSTMVAAVCFFSGVILLFMGLIGEYIGRMFLVIQRSPQFVVRKVYGRKGKRGTNDEENYDSGRGDISGAADPDGEASGDLFHRG